MAMSSSGAEMPFDPRTLNSSLLYVDAQDPFGDGTVPPDGTPLSIWKNLVPGPDLLLVGGAMTPPTFVANSLNGTYNAVRFSGVANECFTTTPISMNTTAQTVFLVVSINSTVNTGGMAILQVGSTYTLRVNTSAAVFQLLYQDIQGQPQTVQSIIHYIRGIYLLLAFVIG
jgi:hypothetical protein